MRVVEGLLDAWHSYNLFLPVLQHEQILQDQGRAMYYSVCKVDSPFRLYAGYAIRSQTSDFPDPDRGEDLQAVRHFNSFTYWNHDNTPKSSDEIPQLMEWLEVSRVLHSTKSPK